MRMIGLELFMIPVGFAVAASNIIGHKVGKNDIPKIKHFFKYSLILATIIAVFLLIFLKALEKVIIEGFTSNKEIQT